MQKNSDEQPIAEQDFTKSTSDPGSMLKERLGDILGSKGSGDDESTLAESDWLAPMTRQDFFEIVQTVAVVLLFRFFIIEPRYIPSLSMYPTLDINDNLAVEKVSKWQHGPERGQIIVFNPPQRYYEMTGREDAGAFIKRCVAVEGDTVEVRDGSLYINGVAQKEPYINAAPTYTLEPTVVPAGNVFALGDNRNESFDSHYWGFLPVKNIIGNALFRYWPLTKIGNANFIPPAP
jgi:signal peptidase I